MTKYQNRFYNQRFLLDKFRRIHQQEKSDLKVPVVARFPFQYPKVPKLPKITLKNGIKKNRRKNNKKNRRRGFKLPKRFFKRCWHAVFRKFWKWLKRQERKNKRKIFT